MKIAYLVDREKIGDLLEGHRKPEIGPVRAVPLHGLLVGHAGERPGQPDPSYGEDADGQVFHHLVDELLVDEGGLHVELSEFGLAVGAKVLVPEAPGDLEIPVHARHHEELFEELRGLGEGVEPPVVDPAGDEIVPRAFGRALGEERGLDLDEVMGVEVLPDGPHDLIALEETLLQGGAAKVEVPVPESQVLVHVCGVGLELFPEDHGLFGDGEGEGPGFGKDLQIAGEHLHLAAREVRVLRPFGTDANPAPDLDHVLFL